MHIFYSYTDDGAWIIIPNCEGISRRYCYLTPVIPFSGLYITYRIKLVHLTLANTTKSCELDVKPLRYSKYDYPKLENPRFSIRGLVFFPSIISSSLFLSNLHMISIETELAVGPVDLYETKRECIQL